MLENFTVALEASLLGQLFIFWQSFSLSHYHPIWQPPKGVYLLNVLCACDVGYVHCASYASELFFSTCILDSSQSTVFFLTNILISSHSTVFSKALLEKPTEERSILGPLLQKKEIKKEIISLVSMGQFLRSQSNYGNLWSFDKSTQRYFISLFTSSQKVQQEAASNGYDTTQTWANQHQFAVFVRSKMPCRAIIFLGSKDAAEQKETDLQPIFPCTPNAENNQQNNENGSKNN